jgi:Family of unknown function (DUF5706)
MYDTSGDRDNGLSKGQVLHAYAENAHSYIRAIPGAIDAKASILLTLLGGSLIYAFDNKLSAFKILPLSIQQLAAAPFAYAYIITSLLSLIFCVLTLRPIGRGDKLNLFSIIAFASRPSAEKLLQEIDACSAQQLIEAQLRHCYELSKLCGQKSRWFNLALCFAMLALISFFLSQI